MEKKRNILFKCDRCSKEEEGGDWYLALPEKWGLTYFNNLGDAGNKPKHFCSLQCFESELDRILKIEKNSRIESFLNK